MRLTTHGENLMQGDSPNSKGGVHMKRKPGVGVRAHSVEEIISSADERGYSRGGSPDWGGDRV